MIGIYSGLGKKIKKFCLKTSIVFGLASALFFTVHYSKPNINKVNMLKEASTYIQVYQGENPKEVLAYAKHALNIINKNNHIKMPEISDLEAEISRSYEKIGESKDPVVYRPFLDSVSGKIEDVINKDRTPITFAGGIFSGIGSLICFGLYSKIDD